MLCDDQTQVWQVQAEHLGQLGFNLIAVDRQVKSKHDNPFCFARVKTKSWFNMP